MKNCLLFAVIVAVITGAGCSKSSNPIGPTESVTWLPMNVTAEMEIPAEGLPGISGSHLTFKILERSCGTGKVGGEHMLKMMWSTDFPNVTVYQRLFAQKPQEWDGNRDVRAMPGQVSQNFGTFGIKGTSQVPMTEIMQIRVPEHVEWVRLNFVAWTDDRFVQVNTGVKDIHAPCDFTN